MIAQPQICKMLWLYNVISNASTMASVFSCRGGSKSSRKQESYIVMRQLLKKKGKYPNSKNSTT
jgi:hypothetical protein